MTQSPFQQQYAKKQTGIRAPFADPTPTPTGSAAQANSDRGYAELIADLLAAPEYIALCQKAFDEVNRRHQQLLVTLSIAALSLPLFPGKKEGDPPRPAGNDAERELAMASAIERNTEMLELSISKSDALNQLQKARNRFEALKLAAQIISQRNS